MSIAPTAIRNITRTLVSRSCQEGGGRRREQKAPSPTNCAPRISWATDIEDAETPTCLDWSRQRLSELERALDPASFGDWLRERTLLPEIDPFAPLPADPDLETPLPPESSI